MEKYVSSTHRTLKKVSLLCLTSLCVGTISLPSQAGESTSSTSQSELQRRIDNYKQGYQKIQEGDQAYNAGDYESAVAAYSSAYSLLPNGTKSAQLKRDAADRYATAATELARQVSGTGDYAQAKQLLNAVLDPSVAPSHIGAAKLLAQLDDPIRYNPSLTPEHSRNVDNVGKLLRKGEGFYNLGNYDAANKTFEEVLRIDPYNSASRRWMERIDNAKADYYRSAFDHARANALMEVDRLWETKVNPDNSVFMSTVPSADLFGNNVVDVRQKLSQIHVDIIDLDQASLTEAIDFVRIKANEHGINVVINTGDTTTDTFQKIDSTRFTLQLRNVPLDAVLDYITQNTHTKWVTDAFSVEIVPSGSSDERLITRSFNVPPNFLKTNNAQQDVNDDPFAETSGTSGGILPQRISIEEYLKQSGVVLGDGAFANYLPANNTLTIRSNRADIDLVAQLVELSSREEPVAIKIETTIMRVSQHDAEALGFDWLISPGYLKNGVYFGGGSVGNQAPLDDIPNPLSSAFASVLAPVTAGNRSGDAALQRSSLDSLLAAGSTGYTPSNDRAPGILTLTGAFSGMQVQMMMRGLDQHKAVDIITKPSVLSRSGEKASIEVIREFIYPTEYEPPELPDKVGSGTTGLVIDGTTGGVIESAQESSLTPITPAHPTAFETRNTGVTMEVEAMVGPNKHFIDLSIRPELVEFEGFVDYGSPITGAYSSFEFNLTGEGGSYFNRSGGSGVLTENHILMPVFKKIGMPSAAVTIADNTTIVLGGMISSKRVNVEDKTPILGDIPYVGRLFRSESSSELKEHIMIAVHVELLDASGRPWREMHQEETTASIK